MVQQESRVRKSLLNARVNLIFYFLTLALSFFSRKIFLDTLGADFVGLTGTLQNLLGFLNLAELGIGSAIGYVLYKPLFEHDESKINEIISVFGYLYRWIGRVILIAGCMLACFLLIIFPNTEFDLELIFFIYFSFLVSSLIGYFANYKQTLLGADQKNYVVTAYFQTASIIKTIIQIVLAYYTKDYYIWVIIEFLFGIIYSVILNWKINKVYPWLQSEVKSGKLLFKKYPEVMIYTKQLFAHKIGGFFQWQATSFIVYAFVSLETVAYYGNYTLLTMKLNNLLENLLGSTRAGVGNLIAEGDKLKIYSTYWELMAIRFLIIGVVTFSVYKLMPPFISLWLGEEYILSNTVLILLMINFCIGLFRGNTEQFNFGYGLFYDVWAPFVEAGICFTTSLIGGYLYGLAGIVFGSTLSLILIVGIWKPYFLFSKGFNLPVIKYWGSFFLYMIISFVSFIITSILIKGIEITYSPYENWLYLICNGGVIVTALFIINFILMYLLTSGMRSFVHRAMNTIKHKLQKTK